jgi:hypothetical protein
MFSAHSLTSMSCNGTVALDEGVPRTAGLLPVRPMDAVGCRWIQRRVDRRLIEVLGRESTAEGLRHLAGAQEAFRGTRWLLSGAPPLPNTRLAWLGAAPVHP